MHDWRALRHLLFSLIIVIGAASLGACGGGGVGDVADGGIGGSGFIDEGGIGGSGISIGPISAFSSIIVNGIHYNTDEAEILMNHHPIALEQLHQGMIVEVLGEVSTEGDTGQAQRIDVKGSIFGPVSQLDLNTGRLIVLGQTVILDGDTLYGSNTNITELNIGDFVHISGLPGLNNNLHAGYLSKTSMPEAAEPPVHLQGYVQQLDEISQSFWVNDIQVSYQEALLTELELSNEAFVDIDGRLLINGLLAAQEIRPGLKFSEITGFRSITGIITAISDTETFLIGNQRVSVDTSTQYQFGVASDLSLGQSLLVMGDFHNNTQPVLHAHQIRFNSATSLRSQSQKVMLQAPIERLQADQLRLQVLGQDIQLLNTTRLLALQQQDQFFDVTHLSLGEEVIIQAFKDLQTQQLYAECLARYPASLHNGDVFLRAILQDANLDSRMIELQGVAVYIPSDAQIFNHLEVSLLLANYQQNLDTGPAIDLADLLSLSEQHPDSIIHVQGQWQSHILHAHTLMILRPDNYDFETEEAAEASSAVTLNSLFPVQQ